MTTPPAITLPPPPIIDAFIFENPWPLVIGLIVLANVIWLGWRYRSGRRAFFSALGCVALAIALGVLAQVVETRAEIARRQTREFVVAVMEGDDATTTELIGDSARILIAGTDLGLDANAIRALVPRANEVIAANGIRLIDGAGSGKNSADSYLDQRTTSPAGLAIPNEWHLQWQQTAPGQWQIVSINWLTWDGRTPSKDMIRP